MAGGLGRETTAMIFGDDDPGGPARDHERTLWPDLKFKRKRFVEIPLKWMEIFVGSISSKIKRIPSLVLQKIKVVFHRDRL
ncbi:MAG: hypothetical protein JSW62_04800 [Thermoplasmatales archaeon]|nr:MAG: hypothetical protein JSW62_04800 [Thermoplasmatales archaeon]